MKAKISLVKCPGSIGKPASKLFMFKFNLKFCGVPTSKLNL